MRLFKQPLFHFLLLGAILFGLYALTSGRSQERTKEIVVSTQQIELLASLWEKQWRRPPTQAEMNGLVESHIREEVLYREALAIGLDKDDIVLRRRLAQKIEMLARDLATQGEPGDAELRTYFQDNSEMFEFPARISFTHVYVNADTHGDESYAVAESIRAELEQGADPSRTGDRFMLPADFQMQSAGQVARQFGADFSEEVFKIGAGAWSGPVSSGYGFHLVFIQEREEAYLPPFEEVRQRVLDEFTTTRRRDADEAFYSRLRASYEITVETPR